MGRRATLRRSTLNLPLLEGKLSWNSDNAAVDRGVPWTKGKLTGPKPPVKLRDILDDLNATSDGIEHPETRAVQSRNR